MSKTRKIIAGIFLLTLLFFVSYLIWRKSEPPDTNAFGDTKVGGIDYSITNPSTDSMIGKRIERIEDLSPVDPFQMVEKFDIRFTELLDAEGDEWASGLEELAIIANRLGEQSDFQSVTVSALMVTRISDLGIARLMSSEVSPDDTLRGLDKFTYTVPSEQRLINYICELHPEGYEQRRKNPSRSVDEFVSRFEEEAIFADDEWSKKKTATGVAISGNATARMMVIGAAQMWLHAARITAIYLQRGGDSSFNSAELEGDLTLLVGKEIEKLPLPLFGEEEPTAGTIEFIIDNAKILYQRR